MAAFLPLSQEYEPSPSLSHIPLSRFDKVDRLAELFRMKPEDVEQRVTLLELQNVSLSLYRHGDGYLVLFENEKTGEIFQIDAGLYAQALKPFVGFTLRGENENFLEFHEREAAAYTDLQYYDPERDSALPPFTLAYFQVITDWASGETLKSALRLSDEDWEYFSNALTYFSLKPMLIPFEENTFVLAFVDREGVYRELPEPFGNIGGFAFERDRWGGGKKITRNKLKDINLEYHQAIGVTDEVKETAKNNDDFVYPSIQQYMNSQWMEAFLDFYFDLKNEDQDKTDRSTAAEDQEEYLELRQKIEAILDPILEKQGLRLVDARELMQPGYNEAITQGIYQNMYPYPIADFLIVERDTSTTQLGYINLLGWEKPYNDQEKNVLNNLIPYGNVCALALRPSDDSLKKRKEISRQAAQQIRRFFPSSRPKPTVFTIDPALVDLAWAEINSPIIEDIDEAAQIDDPNNPVQKLFKSSKHAVDRGYYAGRNFDIIKKLDPPRVELIKHEAGGPQIGGTQQSIVVWWDEKLASIIKLDLGYPFGYFPSWTGLGKFPTYNDGLAPWIGTKMFSRQRRFYRLDLIKNSVNANTLRQVAKLIDKSITHPGNYNDSEFYLLEIYHRLGAEGLTEFLREKVPKETQELMKSGTYLKLLQFMGQREKILYATKVMYDLMALSHDHQDHTLGIALMREDIPLGLSGDTRALAITDHQMASNWLAQDVAAIKRRDLPMVGSAYQVTERPYLLFEDGQRYEVSPGIFVTGYETYHSIIGSMGFVVDVVHNGKHIAQYGHPGDYRDGRFFQKFGQHQLTPEEIDSTRHKKKKNGSKNENGTPSRPVKALSAEATKLGSNQDKIMTELDVRDAIWSNLVEANKRGDIVVIDVVKGAFERLAHIIEDLAPAAHRSIALSARTAHRIKVVQANRGKNNKKKRLLPDVQPGNPNLVIWKPKKNRYRKEETEMFELYDYADVNQLSSNPEQYIVIRENESPIKLDGLGDNVTYLISMYAPYTQAAAQEKKDRRKFAANNGWYILDEGIHASGHIAVVPPDHPLAPFTALKQLHESDADLIIPIHTEKPEQAAKIFEEYLDESTWVLRKQSHPTMVVTLYDPENPGKITTR